MKLCLWLIARCGFSLHGCLYQVLKEVSTSKTGLEEGVKGYTEPQVSKKGLIITCMAGCYFYTGGWAAACWQQRPVEPFIRWPKDALSGALQLTGLLRWMQLLVFPHNGYSITAEQETTKQNVLIRVTRKASFAFVLSINFNIAWQKRTKEKTQTGVDFPFHFWYFNILLI